jgi:hypothetical protein
MVFFGHFKNVHFSIPFFQFREIHRFTLPYHKFSKSRLKNKICEQNFFYFFLNLQTFLKMTKNTRPLAATFSQHPQQNLHGIFLIFGLPYVQSVVYTGRKTRQHKWSAQHLGDRLFATFEHVFFSFVSMCGNNLKNKKK